MKDDLPTKPKTQRTKYHVGLYMVFQGNGRVHRDHPFLSDHRAYTSFSDVAVGWLLLVGVPIMIYLIAGGA
jgi:hypothetical protein